MLTNHHPKRVAGNLCATVNDSITNRLLVNNRLRERSPHNGEALAANRHLSTCTPIMPRKVRESKGLGNLFAALSWRSSQGKCAELDTSWKVYKLYKLDRLHQLDTLNSRRVLQDKAHGLKQDRNAHTAHPLPQRTALVALERCLFAARMVSDFRSRPDRNDIVKVLPCAFKVRPSMRRISQKRQLCKSWRNPLYVRTDFDELEKKWLQTFKRTRACNLLTGDETANTCARRFAAARLKKKGAVKSLNRPRSESGRMCSSYGVVRCARESTWFVQRSDAQSARSIYTTNPKQFKRIDTANLAVAEIRAI